MRSYQCLLFAFLVLTLYITRSWCDQNERGKRQVVNMFCNDGSRVLSQCFINNGQPYCGLGYRCDTSSGYPGYCCDIVTNQPTCSNGRLAVGYCAGSNACGLGQICLNGLCCGSSSLTCPNNQAFTGFCTNNFCAQPGSVCYNGYCCSVCPNGATSIGYCTNGVCNFGYNCVGNVCCPQTSNRCQSNQIDLGSCVGNSLCQVSSTSCINGRCCLSIG